MTNALHACCAGGRKLKDAPQPVARFASIDEALLALGTRQSHALFSLIGGYPLVQDPGFKAR